MSKRPRIGITMRLEIETRRFYLGRDYSEAVEAAGGVPVHLSLIPDREYIEAVVNGLDGILLPGSDTDVDPLLYGEEPHPKLGKVIPDKDTTDRLVIDAAELREIPVFAICYGMQALNVARGGTLIQDIDSQVEGGLKHEQGKPLARSSHSISVDKDSILASLGVVSRNGDSLRVNSHHHQAIGKLGRDLKAVAWAKDGIVECIQDPREDKFVLGVQWHPELSWRTDDLSHQIFEVFVSACQRAGN
jgi:putative glutamine amidotransferase